jgi:hypothetical protein
MKMDKSIYNGTASALARNQTIERCKDMYNRKRKTKKEAGDCAKRKK